VAENKKNRPAGQDNPELAEKRRVILAKNKAGSDFQEKKFEMEMEKQLPDNYEVQEHLGDNRVDFLVKDDAGSGQVIVELKDGPGIDVHKEYGNIDRAMEVTDRKAIVYVNTGEFKAKDKAALRQYGQQQGIQQMEFLENVDPANPAPAVQHIRANYFDRPPPQRGLWRASPSPSGPDRGAGPTRGGRGR
jgi:hypothetical protein